MLDQYGGLIRYTTRLVGHKSGRLQIWEPHDFALVFLDGRLIDTVWRDGGKWEVQLPVSESQTPVLDIVVEAMGRINFAQFMLDRKGITDRVTLNGMTLMAWEIRQYPLGENLVIGSGGMVALEPKSQDGPMQFFKGTFELAETGDTFIDLSAYRKGVVWINGHNLGRYWNRGPQQRLYCPAPFLKKGRNEIMIFDLLQTEAHPVRGTPTGRN
jgi:beta-galactosidase